MNLVKIIFSLVIYGLTNASFIPIKYRLSAKNLPIEKPILAKDHISLCDGEVVGGKLCVYKCKTCDMPRLFVMNYGSHIGLWKKRIPIPNLFKKKLFKRS